MIDSELYEAMRDLADDLTFDIVSILSPHITDSYKLCGDDFAKYERALRYLELREQSGDPLPYKVIREGDKVRFE